MRVSSDRLSDGRMVVSGNDGSGNPFNYIATPKGSRPQKFVPPSAYKVFCKVYQEEQHIRGFD